MVFFGAVLGGIIARAPVPCVLFASIGAALISAASQAINDYYDYDVDRKKGRRTVLSRREILHVSLALYVLGNAATLLATPLHFVVALVASLATWAYSAFLSGRKYLGNVVVAFFTAFVFVFAGLCGNAVRLLFPFFLAFLAAWAREVIKDIEDLPADRGYKMTLPMLVGPEMAGYFAAYLILLAVFFSPFPGPIGFGIFGEWYYYVLIPADALFIISALYVIRGHPRRAQQLCKVAMILALLAFAAGTIL